MLVLSKTGNIAATQSNLQKFAGIGDLTVWQEQAEWVSHPTQLTSSFRNNPRMRMSNDHRKQMGTGFAEFAATVTGGVAPVLFARQQKVAA